VYRKIQQESGGAFRKMRAERDGPAYNAALCDIYQKREEKTEENESARDRNK
jgi:hypothetical protein